jgi:hypothetical protein
MCKIRATLPTGAFVCFCAVRRAYFTILIMLRMKLNFISLHDFDFLNAIVLLAIAAGLICSAFCPCGRWKFAHMTLVVVVSKTKENVSVQYSSELLLA